MDGHFIVAGAVAIARRDDQRLDASPRQVIQEKADDLDDAVNFGQECLGYNGYAHDWLRQTKLILLLTHLTPARQIIQVQGM